MKYLLIALLTLTSSAFAATAAKKTAPATASTAPASHAPAAYHAPTQGSGSAYGMAGCGLGSLVFKENTKMQILAATTNGTFGSQTFGITFGTSNCNESGLMASKEQVQSFIAANTNALQNDIARGNGEALNGLAELMGHKNSTEFNSKLQSNYSKIFAATSASEITANLYSIL